MSTWFVIAVTACLVVGMLLLIGALIGAQSASCRAPGGHLKNTGTLVLICVSADGRILE